MNHSAYCRKCNKLLTRAEYSVNTYVGLCNQCYKEQVKIDQSKSKRKKHD